jgi:hypothetical protein
MKPSNKILLLTVTVACIIVLWLAPGINKSNAKRYTRVYENTDAKRSADPSDTLKAKDSSTRKIKKTKSYLSESIKADAKVTEIRPKMFSRAMQFNEEILVIDSNANLTEVDSIKIVYEVWLDVEEALNKFVPLYKY